MGWLTATRFLSSAYLSSDFFPHALLTIAIVLLLSFFALQALVRLAVRGDRLQARALLKVQAAMGDHPLVAGREVAEQVAQVLALGEDKEQTTKHQLFGIWKDNETATDVDRYVREARKER